MHDEVPHQSWLGTAPYAKGRDRWIVPALCGLLELACAGGTAPEPAVPNPPEAAKSSLDKVNLSRCEHEGRADREAVDSVGIGSIQPSIRRVYRLVGEGDERRRILVCREVDTNLDGVKDLVRQYSEYGEMLEEQADSNYDGVIDTWIRFNEGRVVQVEIDDAFDGQPDETRHYKDGKLTRIERDTNQDGEADVWEIYVKGRLDRMGVDLNYDGRVDRWNRDALVGSEVERTGRDEGSTNANGAALDE